MPPKPHLRLPKKLSPILAPRSAPPSGNIARPAPQAPHKPSPLHAREVPPSGPHEPHSKTPWYRTSRARQAARYTTLGSRIVVTWCCLVWVRDHIIRFDAIRGSSMASTINPRTHETGQSDWVFFAPYWERYDKKAGPDGGGEWVGGVQRGDVVTFWKPHKPEEVSVKRVVAIAGDTVYPKRGYALDPEVVLGERLQGMPDGLPEDEVGTVLEGRNQLGKIVVPYGHVWVEGDNARQSLDSNDFGPISARLIKEKAVWIWRDWTALLRVEDKRSRKEKNMASMVVPGNSEIPAIFLE